MLKKFKIALKTELVLKASNDDLNKSLFLTFHRVRAPNLGDLREKDLFLIFIIYLLFDLFFY
jgi:hypothetical protein